MSDDTLQKLIELEQPLKRSGDLVEAAFMASSCLGAPYRDAMQVLLLKAQEEIDTLHLAWDAWLRVEQKKQSGRPKPVAAVSSE